MKKLFLLLLLPSLAFAKPVLNIQYWHTANGTPVYFVKSAAVPMVDVAVVFNAGSVQDHAQPGLANVTNAMLGEHTDTWDADTIAERFADVGAVFNNSVSRNMALVSFRSLTNRKKLMSALNTFTAALTAAEFPRNNFNRVSQQIIVTMKGEKQDAANIASKTLMRQIFGNSAYAHDTLGTPESVGDISRSDVKEFYQRYYVARNAFVAIVGNVNKSEAEIIAEHIMNRLPTGEPAKQPVVPENTLGKYQHIPFPSTQNHIRMGEISISRSDKNYAPLAVGNYILGNGFTSRLFKQVRDQRGLSYYVGSTLLPMPSKSLFIIALQTQNASTKEAIKVTKDTIAKFIKEGPTALELSNAKRSITGTFPLMFDSNAAILNCIVTLGYFHLPLNYYDKYRAKILAVTVPQIQQAFQHDISLKHLTIVSVGGHAN